jgi:O-antigen ligase
LFFSVFLIVFPFREKFFLFLLAFIIPLKLRKFIIYEPACNMDVVKELQRLVLTRYTPLYRIQEIEGFAVYGFDIILFVLISIWIYRLTLSNKRIFFFPKVTIPFIFIFSAAFFGILNAELSLTIKISSLYEMFKCWVVFLYISNNLSDSKTVYLIVGAILLSGLFQSLVGISQYITKKPLGLQFLGEPSSLMIDQSDSTGSNSRIGGTMGHPNKLAIFLGIILQLNMACLFAKFPVNMQWHVRSMYIISFIPMLFTLFASYSRSGWFSFLVGGAINCSLCMIKRTGKKIFSILVVSGIFIIFAAIVFVISESVRNRILMDDQGASEIREPLAQVAKNVIRHNPILGIGLNNYTSCYPEYDNTSSYWLTGVFPEVVHNEFLLILAELGIPSFILFLYIMISTSVVLLKISKSDCDPVIPYIAIGFICGFISWSLHSQKEYQYVFFTTRFWFNIGIAMALNIFCQNQASIKDAAFPKESP